MQGLEWIPEEDCFCDDQIDDYKARSQIFYDKILTQQRLEKQIEDLIKSRSINESAPKCCVCLTNNPEVILKCNHYCVCLDCVVRIHFCPICRLEGNAFEIVYTN